MARDEPLPGGSADAELLITRLQPPPLRAVLVERARLRRALHSGLQHALTLIVAPAGFGKTTALAQALGSMPTAAATAWLSLDTSDNDPARFWRYVVAALERALPGAWDRVTALLRATAAYPAEPVITALLNGAAAASHPLVLALDDYYLIENPAIHAALATLIERAPPQLHLIIASRTPPPLPLERWRVRGRMAEIQLASLRFTEPEATALFHEVLGLPLPIDAVHMLVERTDGWGAGLILAALAAHGRPDPARFAASFSGASPAVLDYVLTEVLDSQPPPLRDFLLRTAALERFSAELCAAVVGPSDDLAAAHALIAQIERAHLFLVPLDDERRWFRYHHLFADVLRAYLLRTDPALLRDARQRAAIWLADHGAPTDAIPLALAAHDWALAARLIAECGRAALLRSEVTTVQTWLAALPTSDAAHPRLRLLDAWVRVLLSDLEGAATQAQLAMDVPGDHEPEAQLLQTMVALLHGRQLAAVPLHVDETPQNAFLRMITLLNEGFSAQFAGEMAAAQAAFGQALRVSQVEENSLITFIAGCQLGEVQLAQGRPRAARAVFERALALAQHAGEAQTLFIDSALVGLGVAAYELGQFERATTLLADGLAQRSVLGELAALDGRICQAHLAGLRGDAARANEELDAALAGADQLGIPVFVALTAARVARVRASLGQLDAAAAWLAEPTPADMPLAMLEAQALVRAQVLLALGRQAEALALAEPLVVAALQGGRGRHSVEAQLVCALALERQGRTVAARETLAAARAAAAAEGLVAVFLEAGLDRADRTEPHLPAGLTEREVEVLRLIHAGLSNTAIAAHLIVAPSTVKKHINRIFAKLDATSRTEALVRARRLGVLESDTQR